MLRKLIHLLGLVALIVVVHVVLAPRDVAAYLLRDKGSSVFKLAIPSNHESGGTGFSMRMPSGDVLTVTNSHVCYLAEDGHLDAMYRDGSQESLSVVKISDETDLCLMTHAHHAPALNQAQFFDIYARLNIIGHPKLQPLTYQEGRIVGRQVISIPIPFVKPEQCVGKKFQIADMVSWFGPLRMCVMTVDAFNTTLRSFGGNSGSPILDDDGYVVGVLFAGNNETHWGMIVPLDSLRKFVQEF